MQWTLKEPAAGLINLFPIETMHRYSSHFSVHINDE